MMPQAWLAQWARHELAIQNPEMDEAAIQARVPLPSAQAALSVKQSHSETPVTPAQIEAVARSGITTTSRRSLFD